jgi:hypothetical protein
MSETAGAENVIPPVEAGTGQVEADNPAWNEFLAGVPQGMHDVFKPHLRKWDDGVNARIQSVHSEYADWKPLKDQGITPEQIQQGLGIYQAIEADPRRVYDILGQTYGYANAAQMMQNSGQGQQNPQQPEPTAEYQFGQPPQQPNPEIARLNSMVETMGGILLAQRNAEIERQQDAILDKELKDLKAKIGDFDETFVVGMMQTGLTAEQAGAKWNEWRSNVIAQSNRPAAPSVISGSGPLPSNAIDPTKLDKKNTVSLAAEMMRAANRQQ